MELHNSLVEDLITRDTASVDWFITKGRLVLSTEQVKSNYVS